MGSKEKTRTLGQRGRRAGLEQQGLSHHSRGLDLAPVCGYIELRTKFVCHDWADWSSGEDMRIVINGIYSI